MKRYSLLGLWVCFLTALSFSADIYVSPSGNDAASGTLSAPLATIEKARDMADIVKASGPVNVYLMGGTYYLTAPVIFGTSNSGTATAPITFRSYNGQKAIISGGVKVTSTWTTSSGSIMKTTIAANLKVDQLFLNGTRQILARYPNYNAATAILNGYSSDAISKAGTYANPAEGPGYIRALHQSQWGGNDYYITGKTGTTANYQWVGDNNRGSGPHATYQMIENIYELLDAPGEWFYRKSTGELWFYPPAGTDLNTSTIELASISQLIRFVGSGANSSNSVKYINFDNIAFTHTYRSLFDSTGQFYEKVTGSDWGICRKGAVFMQNAENITIQNCLFDQVGGNGVFLSGYNRRNVVYNSVFKGTGASCVCLFGLRSSIRCPNSWNTSGNTLAGTCSASDTIPGPLTEEYPAYCVIKNNLMDTLGVFEKQTSGVALSATQYDTIRHNTICHIPRAGINFCDGCWGGTVVDYNWVYDCVRETSDHGPFNAWGRDRNMILGGQSNPAASKYDAVNPTIVRMNRFEAPRGMFGIDLDDQATNYYQEKNLLIGGGHKLQWNRYNVYLNNIILRGGNVQFHGVWSSSNHYGARNIITGANTCLYQKLSGNTPQTIKGAITQWDSNVVYSTAGSPTITDWSQTASCGGGTVYSWSNWQTAGLDANSSTANPGFVDTLRTWTGRTPPYLPVGDFNPTSSVALTTLRFQTFAMDSFGVVGTTPGLTGIKGRMKGLDRSEITKAATVQYSAHRLAVSCNGDYHVSITSATTGRTLAIFYGKGSSSFALDPKRFGSGLYFAVVHTTSGMISRRFIIRK